MYKIKYLKKGGGGINDPGIFVERATTAFNPGTVGKRSARRVLYLAVYESNCLKCMALNALIKAGGKEKKKNIIFFSLFLFFFCF